MKTDVLAKAMGSPSTRRGLMACVGFLLSLLGFWTFVQLTEAGPSQRKIAVLTIVGLYCLALAATRQPRQSVIVTLLVTLTVWGVSQAKMAYLGTPFVFGDLVNMVGYNFWWVLWYYAGLAVAFGLVAMVFLALLVWLVTRPAPRVSLVTVGAAGVLAVMLAQPIAELSRSVYVWDRNFDETAAGISTFTASAVWWWASGGNSVTLYDVARTPLDDPAASDGGAPSSPRPNIFMVLEESVFDPRVLGLPVQSEVARYFQPPEGLSGALSVHVHGGGTWVSEFAVMSGVDTRAFGDKAYYLPALMEKRVHHSLIHALKGQGYRTVVVYSVNGKFMNAENFYRSLGVEEFHVPSEVASNRSLRQFRDSALYDHALRLMASNGEGESDDPVFILVVTISNHGPHSRAQLPKDAFPEARSWLTRSLGESGLEEYREYYLRLKQGIADYEGLKAALAERFKARPTLLVRFGDHHPQFTRRLAEEGGEARESALLTTYFAIEAVNGDLAARPDWGGGPIDIAYLPTLVLDTAGLPKDQIFEIRRQLMESCGGRYAGCSDARKARLHRTLVDRGYLQVDRVELAEVESGPAFYP